MEKIQINQDNFKYLKEGIPHIIVCVETYKEKDIYKIKELEHIKKLKENSQYIKYRGSFEYNKKNNIISNKEGEYSISEINESDKYTDKSLNCTIFVVAGLDKETGENISFLTHQESGENISNKEFLESFSEQLKIFVEMCEPKTIDALIFGGNKNDGSFNEYKDAINTISNISKSMLGFNPEVATGPKLGPYETQGYFNTQKRQLYILMPEQEKNVYDSYDSSKVEEYLTNLDKLS